MGHAHHFSAGWTDTLPQNAMVHTVHSGLKLITTIATVFLCVGFDSLYCHLFIMVTMLGMMVVLCGCPFGRILSMMVVPSAFIVLSCVTVAVQVTTAPAPNSLRLLGLSFFLTHSSCAQAFALFCKAYSATTCLFFLITSTSLPDMIATLRTWKCPALLLELMYLIYRYLFVLLEVQSAMMTAAHARLGYATYKRSWYTFTHMGGNVLIHAFKRSSACFDAMESRLYNGQLNFYTKSIPLQPVHLLWCGGYLAITVAAGLWR